MAWAEVERDYAVGTRVRVRPGSQPERWSLQMGYSTLGEVVAIDPTWGEQVRVQWDKSHALDRRAPHRETIALEHIEPL